MLVNLYFTGFQPFKYNLVLAKNYTENIIFCSKRNTVLLKLLMLGDIITGKNLHQPKKTAKDLVIAIEDYEISIHYVINDPLETQ